VIQKDYIILALKIENSIVTARLIASGKLSLSRRPATAHRFAGLMKNGSPTRKLSYRGKKRGVQVKSSSFSVQEGHDKAYEQARFGKCALTPKATR